MNCARFRQNGIRRYVGTFRYLVSIIKPSRARTLVGNRKLGTTSAYVPTAEKAATTGPATAPGREGKGTI